MKLTSEELKNELRSRMINNVVSPEIITHLRNEVSFMGFVDGDRGVIEVLINDYERLSKEIMDQVRYIDQLGEVDLDPNLQMSSRNSILRQVEREWEGTRRYHTPTSLIMCGIDGIDEITEISERQQIYKELAVIIDTSTRMTDTFGRIDDVRFLIIVPTTNNIQAAWLSDKLRETIESYTFECGIPLTASFGVAESGASMDTTDWMIITEEAFEKAKENAGNAVVDYEANIEK